MLYFYMYSDPGRQIKNPTRLRSAKPDNLTINI